MILIEVIHQAERLGRVSYVEVEPEVTFAALRKHLTQQHWLDPDGLLSLDERAEPVDEARLVKDYATPAGLKVHIRRCHRAEEQGQADATPGRTGCSSRSPRSRRF
jgi:hypothetical protein